MDVSLNQIQYSHSLEIVYKMLQIIFRLQGRFQAHYEHSIAEYLDENDANVGLC